MHAQRLVSTLVKRAPLQARSVLARPAARTYSVTRGLRDVKVEPKMVPFEEIKTEEDLLPPGAAPGTIPTDLEQATGLERLEILGKMQGIDVFDLKPLPSDRKGTLENPIIVKGAGDEIQAGCTGYPADSHHVRWNVLSRERPIERCDECGSVYKYEYIGPAGHDDHHHSYKEPPTMADFVKPEYWYK